MDGIIAIIPVFISSLAGLLCGCIESKLQKNCQKDRDKPDDAYFFSQPKRF